MHIMPGAENSAIQQELEFMAILTDVSRSFNLTRVLLPFATSYPISLAYLLARAAYLITHCTALASTQRLAALQQFQQQVQDYTPASALLNIKANNETDARLLAYLPTLYRRLAHIVARDRLAIRKVLETLSNGFIYSLQTFPDENTGQIIALPDLATLDHYTYMIAGCMGEFWSDINIAHTRELQHLDKQHYRTLAMRFAQGLQLVNILRDLASDLRIGRCYLPQTWLAQHGLNTAMLLNSQYSNAARPLLIQTIQLSLEHFNAAEQYLLAIPRSCMYARLAYLAPLIIALSTLNQLAHSDNWLDTEQVCQLKRSWTFRIKAYAHLNSHSNRLLLRWIAKLKKQVLLGIQQ